MYLATVPMGYLVVVLPLYPARAGLEPPFIGLLYTVSGVVSAALVACSGSLLAAGIFGLPLLVGAVMYIAGGVVFGVGFGRIQRRDAAAATVAATRGDAGTPTHAEVTL